MTSAAHARGAPFTRSNESAIAAATAAGFLTRPAGLSAAGLLSRSAGLSTAAPATGLLTRSAGLSATGLLTRSAGLDAAAWLVLRRSSRILPLVVRVCH